MTRFQELYWIPLSSSLFFCRCTWTGGPSSCPVSPRPPVRSLAQLSVHTGPYAPAPFIHAWVWLSNRPGRIYALACQDTDPSRLEQIPPGFPWALHNFLLASPAVEGTQVPVRIHPEIYAVTVTDQKNKLHRILREDGEGEMLWAGVEGQGPGGQGNSTLSVVAAHKWSYKNSSTMNLFARHHRSGKPTAKKIHPWRETLHKEVGSRRNVGVCSPVARCIAPPSGPPCGLVYQNVLAILGQLGRCWRSGSVMTDTESKSNRPVLIWLTESVSRWMFSCPDLKNGDNNSQGQGYVKIT